MSDEIVIDNADEQNTTDTLDTPTESGNNGQSDPSPPPAPTVPQIDFAALYRESLQERNRLQQEADNLRNARNAPPEEDITDEHLEKFGTTATLKKLIRNELKESLGDVSIISQDYKRGKQIESAEATFFQQFPQAAGIREQLSQVTRQALQHSSNIDATTYAQAAAAAIGLYSLNNLAQQMQNGGQQAASQNNAPARPSAPTPRANGSPTPASIPRLTELERKAMRNAGFDPNKREDYDNFMNIVNNDEGVTV